MDRQVIYKNAVELYGLDWDYKLDNEISPYYREAIENIKYNLKKKILSKIKIIKDFKIVFGKAKQNGIALYINGSYTWKPIILLDLKEHEKGCKKYDLDILEEIEISILHELAHAIQDKLDIEFREEEAEDFALAYSEHRFIWKFWR